MNGARPPALCTGWGLPQETEPWAEKLKPAGAQVGGWEPARGLRASQGSVGVCPSPGRQRVARDTSRSPVWVSDNGPASHPLPSSPAQGDPSPQLPPPTQEEGEARAESPGRHLVPDPYPLVEVLGEGLPGDEAAHALADVDVAILEDDLALADDHQRGAVALHAFEDVVVHGLRGENHRVWSAPQAFLCMSPVHPDGDSATRLSRAFPVFILSGKHLSAMKYPFVRPSVCIISPSLLNFDVAGGFI